MPQVTARRLREERLQRIMFTATRAAAADAPAVIAVRQALADTARRVASPRRDVELVS
jgi:hypothetical protein